MKYKFVTKYTLITLFIVAQNLYSQDSYILNYEDVDIRKVTQDIAQFSKKTIILDPRVKGKVTIYSNANLDSNQIWDVYLRTIQVNGFSAISEDSFVRVVPENEATRDQTRDYSNGGGFETEVIPLINRSTEEILPMIKPITGRQSHLSSIPSVNSILIVDRASNIERIKKLLLDLDKNNTAKISIIKLENLSSIEAVRILDRLKAQNNPTINKFIGSLPVLGNILVGSKTGEGVFGVSFKIKGPPKKLETSVNPIKTLTPRFITRTLEKIKKKKE